MTGPGQGTRGRICTFYSYKGGVGRSMALANVGVLMAQWGYRVLLVDWDLEAPGLDRYFDDIAQQAHRLEAPGDGILELARAMSQDGEADWQRCVVTISLPQGGALDFIGAGRPGADYAQRLQSLDWEGLFADHDFGASLEMLRDEWLRAYDFVLIDSRTGITDIGGICTIYLPDVLVAMFTANHQSVEGVADVVNRARRARSGLPVDRVALTCVPVPARDESRIEYEQSLEWRREYERLLGPLYQDFLPRDVSPAEALDLLRIPSVPYWSFGERLPVLTESPSDPSGITYYYSILARLLTNELSWYASLPSMSASSRDGPASGEHRTTSGDRSTTVYNVRGNLHLGATPNVATTAAYLEEVRDLAPAQLLGRDRELAELAAFCHGDEPYVWWKGDPWTGKTALMSWFALNPPDDVDVISFFVSRQTGQADSTSFAEATFDKLARYLGQGSPAVSPTIRDAALRLWFETAADYAQGVGRKLVLLVDGLDEDQSQQARQRLPSIASLLPAHPQAALRVVVASRTNPPLPSDVPATHPLRTCTAWILSPSTHADVPRYLARDEILDLVSAGQAEQDVVGCLAASGGGLTSEDLEDLTGLPPYHLGLILDGPSGRSFSRQVATSGRGVPVYSLAHEMLRAEAESAIGDRQIHKYSDKLTQLVAPPSDGPAYLPDDYLR